MQRWAIGATAGAAEFVEVYGEEICCKLELAPDTKLPSYSTFRRVMQQLDYHVVAKVFTDWAKLQHKVDSGEWFARDGKTIKGSVTEYTHAQQNFVSMVSLFSQTSRCGASCHANGTKTGERARSRASVAECCGIERDWRDAGRFTLSKKHCTRSSSKATMTSCVSKQINSACTEASSNNRRRNNRSVSIKNTNKLRDGA